MFPIPSGRKLSVVEISDYWSREIKPSASPQELRDVISKAWWRGELVAANGSSRLSVLRGYYLRSADFIAFVIPGMEEPPQWRSVDDGVVEFVRPLRVPLPNADSDTWTDANCAEAFEAIAEQWNEAIIFPSAPLFLDIALARIEFLQWLDACQYERPTFWGKTSEDRDKTESTGNLIPQVAVTGVQSESDKSGKTFLGNASDQENEQHPAAKTVRQERIKPVQFHIQRAVAALAKEREGEFPPVDMKPYERDRLITEWLAGDDDPVKKPSKRTLREYFRKTGS